MHRNNNKYLLCTEAFVQITETWTGIKCEEPHQTYNFFSWAVPLRRAELMRTKNVVTVVYIPTLNTQREWGMDILERRSMWMVYNPTDPVVSKLVSPHVAECTYLRPQQNSQGSGLPWNLGACALPAQCIHYIHSASFYEYLHSCNLWGLLQDLVFNAKYFLWHVPAKTGSSWVYLDVEC